ncbi:hypothetical protein HAHE_06140 [Haloferula helveola]|uniref:Uncharacterized protein n=1 Tax=Haloferula helveola TaxID=490095 RepID=A0ABN6GZJ2_9BACT|nr:hypothetical protein HAHE_06140 [Haloferula helveola]
MMSGISGVHSRPPTREMMPIVGFSSFLNAAMISMIQQTNIPIPTRRARMDAIGLGVGISVGAGALV